MNVREYLARFEALKKAIKRDEKLLSVLTSHTGCTILDKLTDGSFSLSTADEVGKLVFDSEQLKKKLAARNRLLEKYTLKLTRAVLLIDKRPLRDYIVNHYLYGFSHEQVAEMNHYCERQIYRQAQEARRALYLALLTLKPKLRRKTGGKYRITRRIQNPRPFHRRRLPGIFSPRPGGAA